jgi:DNA-binding LytR/AlgR family response regulator
MTTTLPTAYLLDDEPLALKRLQRMLDATRRVTIAGMSTDPVEAEAYLRTHRVDLLFIDIEMPEMSGFELLHRLDPHPLVVFTTAYSQYALQAFEVHSIDYLLKPVDEASLDRALTKMERMLGGKETAAAVAFGRQGGVCGGRQSHPLLCGRQVDLRRDAAERVSDRIHDPATGREA